MRYPKIFRIHIDSWPKVGKHYLTDYEIELLLSKEVIIEEKIDGKLQEYDKEGYFIFAEFMKYKHSIYYDDLPSYEIGLDIYEGTKFLNYDEKCIIFRELNIHTVPILYRGIANIGKIQEFIDKKSNFSDMKQEGIVIKNYELQLFGKIVNPEFEDKIDKHWSKKSIMRNKINAETKIP